MLRKPASLACAAVCASVSCVTLGVAAQQSGQNQQLLVQALEASAQGECPESIMSPLLVDACEQQMPTLGSSLAQLGEIRDTKYRGVQQTQAGPAEVYRVVFQNGQMTWMINTGSDGKIVVLWSPGK